MTSWFPSFVDEMIKIAVSRGLSTYGPQSRIGRRPIRVAKALEKDSDYWAHNGRENWRDPEDESDDAKFYSHEGYQQYTTVPESGDDKGQHFYASGA